jgi:RNA polymerase sigma-70 factor (sigma-E family)
VLTTVEAAVGAMTLSRGRAAELYHEHSAGAVRLAYLLTGDKYMAEDLTQDAFVRAFGRFQDLRRAEAFAAYLKRTIVNLSKDHFRRLQKERDLARRERNVITDDDDRYRHVDARDELLDLLQALPPRQRAAVVLRHCEGLSEHEVAEILRTTAGAVNSLVARGLTALRGQVKEGDDSD